MPRCTFSRFMQMLRYFGKHAGTNGQLKLAICACMFSLVGTITFFCHDCSIVTLEEMPALHLHGEYSAWCKSEPPLAIYVQLVRSLFYWDLQNLCTQGKKLKPNSIDRLLM